MPPPPPTRRVTSGVAVSVRAAPPLVGRSTHEPFAIRTCVRAHNRRARARCTVDVATIFFFFSANEYSKSYRNGGSIVALSYRTASNPIVTYYCKNCSSKPSWSSSRDASGFCRGGPYFARATATSVGRRPFRSPSVRVRRATGWHEPQTRRSRSRRRGRRRGGRVVHVGRPRGHRVRRRAAGRRGRDTRERRQRDGQTDVVHITRNRVNNALQRYVMMLYLLIYAILRE